MAVRVQTYKLLCEYRFKPSLLFYDVKNNLGNALFSHGYKHWNTDGLRIGLSNFENRSVLAIDHNRLILEVDVPESPEEFRSKFERAFKEYTAKVTVETYLRFGMRTQSMIPVEFKFDELVKITHEKFLREDERLLGIIGAQVDDYMYNVVTEKAGYKLHVICGPVRKVEIPRWYQPANVVIDPGEEPKEIKYPDVALFIDCDCYISAPKSEMVQHFLDNALRITTSVPLEIGEYALGE